MDGTITVQVDDDAGVADLLRQLLERFRSDRERAARFGGQGETETVQRYDALIENLDWIIEDQYTVHTSAEGRS